MKRLDPPMTMPLPAKLSAYVVEFHNLFYLNLELGGGPGAAGLVGWQAVAEWRRRGRGVRAHGCRGLAGVAARTATGSCSHKAGSIL